MISLKSILFLSMILGLSLCHEDHSHPHTHSFAPTASATVAPSPLHTHFYDASSAPVNVVPDAGLHTHYYNGAAATASAASNLHTHYYDGSASASPASNLHTHYWTPERPVLPVAPEAPVEAVAPPVVHEHQATAFVPTSRFRVAFSPPSSEIIRYQEPVINRRPIDTRPIPHKRKPLPYLPGYKWNNYTMTREE